VLGVQLGNEYTHQCSDAHPVVCSDLGGYIHTDFTNRTLYI